MNNPGSSHRADAQRLSPGWSLVQMLLLESICAVKLQICAHFEVYSVELAKNPSLAEARIGANDMRSAYVFLR
jgi:hypothetical protein